MDKIIWTDNAIQDLNDIGEYIAKDSERYAQITVNKLFDSVEILEEYPFAGKMVDDFQDENIRELVRGNYRIVYQIINENRIEILTFHNCARLLGNTFEFSGL
jgi:toxin ParE1/3/4